MLSPTTVSPPVNDQAAKPSIDSSSEPDGRQASREVSNTPKQSIERTVGPKSSSKLERHLKVWICCQCGDSGMTINVPSCPVCYRQRCINCSVAKVRRPRSAK
ncbi:hypothetical protein LZ30DRAFT_605512 [Colletotrichum cereale]|nr:hypothetical protein LZ30DRAFT_605512 [Colletotrichum cereale]